MAWKDNLNIVLFQSLPMFWLITRLIEKLLVISAYLWRRNHITKIIKTSSLKRIQQCHK